MKAMQTSATVVCQLEKTAAKETIEAALEYLGLSKVELARALGVDRRTIFRYRNRVNVPSRHVRAKMEKLREIQHLLSEIFDGRDAQLNWLCSPVPLLRGSRPIDLLRRGDIDEVLSILAGLHSGAQM
ncbi:MAG: DUF2384 domain-containing protein [Candidatus Aegiribacteria sp.]|nr:DUF2384 domain-containing protein [Candidatus Aegiribacteria sp.]